MKLEFHQLNRRYEHLRVRRSDEQRRLMASLAASGQQTPIVVVVVTDKPDGYLVIDGFKRIAALEQLGRDTVEAVIWPMSECDALVLERSMQLSQRDTALEEGWLLQELHDRFGYSLDDLARRFDRSTSWVSRRLALVELLPQKIQQRIRMGEISAHVAMKYLAPVARGNIDDCQRMADAFATHHFTSRQASEFYAAWRDASPEIRQRILDDPELFLKAREQVEPQPPKSADELLRDLTMVVAITNRASRRLTRAAPLMDQDQFDAAQRKIACALKDLEFLSHRIQKEQEQHVEQRSTDRDSGAPCPESQPGPDRESSRSLAFHRTQSAAIAVLRCAVTEPIRESGTIPAADSGGVGQLQGQSRPGP
jgi:ParB family transcriptional regulator, chromosome partitioning protein